MSTEFLPDRLPFRLPEFIRVSWVDVTARATWKPRLKQIYKMWRKLEFESVATGLRECGLQRVSPNEYAVSEQNCQERGLACTLLHLESLSDRGYRSTSESWAPGRKLGIVMAFGDSAAVVSFSRAWQMRDDEVMGSLLGYPACCREFFRCAWVKQGLLDTTWAMAVGDRRPSSSTVEHPLEIRTNILSRWLSCRPVPYLPCSVYCPSTQMSAVKWEILASASGLSVEMGWQKEILSWPVEWSALHGIAEIKTPLWRISTATDATAGKYVVRLLSKSYPAKGAKC